LGQILFALHVVFLLYAVFGWLAPWRDVLVFYVIFLPALVLQWRVNQNSCVLNNLESLIRTGRWRNPANDEEGAWLLTLARNALGISLTPARMDALIYAVVAVLWGFGLIHLLRLGAGLNP